ncbi:MAG: phosphatidylinositol kinase, partial [Acidimicrobiia bacterium]|nr:phosphatidylinositol kinase [Acidimicrobiia bacterium]
MNSTLRLDEVLGRMPYASNTTLLARDAAGGLWVYKPVRGEQPLWDFPWKTLAAREVLSFEISDAMGLDLVPETVMATGPFGPGSAQRFLEEDVEFDPRPLFTGVLDPVLWPFAVFDIVTNNADRKIGHMLREVGSDKLWAIDNGLTFHAEPKLRTVLWGFAGQPIPGELLEATRRLDAALDTSLCDRVASLLSPAEAGALVSRTRTLLAARTHPEPPDDRPAV